MDFITWLKTYEHKNTMRGDLAKDLIRSNNIKLRRKEPEIKTYYDLLWDMRNACDGAMRSLKRVVAEHKKLYPDQWSI